MFNKKDSPLSRRAFLYIYVCIHGYEPRDLFNLESATTKSCSVYVSYCSVSIVDYNISAAKVSISFQTAKLFAYFFNKT